MSRSWITFSEWMLDALFPLQCLGCKDNASSAKGFCIDCREQLVRQPPCEVAGLSLHVPYRYEGPLATAIVRLKYEDRPELAPRLVRACFLPFTPAGFEAVTLVPVPMHADRICSRGYNQAALLARALGRSWRRPVAYRWLERRRLLVRQVGLGKAERAQNVRGAFTTMGGTLEGKRVVLVDDVVTTGATLCNCAEALTAAGASVLAAVALARADHTPQVPAENRAIGDVLGLGL